MITTWVLIISFHMFNGDVTKRQVTGFSTQSECKSVGEQARELHGESIKMTTYKCEERVVHEKEHHHKEAK